jgi:hypothetical protein
VVAESSLTTKIRLMFAALSGAGITGAGVVPLPVPPHPQKKRRNTVVRKRARRMNCFKFLKRTFTIDSCQVG